ncbi:unnamed protein product [Acanthosepion pharaonis]|uniref:Uncharacterized protein n=1 Tax=Acanthosepion pharaonis TaxID=158019 RepID=A0A812DBD8_ACAPH|nr:unnamed protein product [Sepia pharaonis]
MIPQESLYDHINNILSIANFGYAASLLSLSAAIVIMLLCNTTFLCSHCKFSLSFNFFLFPFLHFSHFFISPISSFLPFSLFSHFLFSPISTLFLFLFVPTPIWLLFTLFFPFPLFSHFLFSPISSFLPFPFSSFFYVYSFFPFSLSDYFCS